MKKTAFILLSFLLFSAPLYAETSVWKVQSKSSLLYLGGTIHVLKSSDFPLPKEFDIAYADSDLVIFETDIGGVESLKTQQLILAKGMYDNGMTLRKALSSEAYDALKEYCDGIGLPVASLNRYKPSIVVLTLLLTELQNLGIVSGGVDHHFFHKTVADGKKTDIFETIEEHIDSIISMGEGNENHYMIYSIKDLKNVSQTMSTMTAAWRSGDVNKLSELFAKEMKKNFPKLYKSLLTDRNNKWLDKIETYLQTPQKEFVLVGVGHMAGKDGLIEQLKRRGYEVKKLNSTTLH